jgi:chemotaxis protein methyltransferase CheR
MYFLPQHAKNVVNKLSRSLVSSGWLLVSPSEMSHELFPDFEPVQLSGTLCYRKNPDRPHVDSLHSLQISSLPPLEHDTTNEFDTASIPPSVQEFPAGDSDRQAEETPESGTPEEVYSEAHRLYDRGNFAGALERIRSGLPESPDDARHLALSARILAGQGDLAGAEEQCLKAIAADKLNAVYRYFYAVILHEQGRDDDAVTSLQKAIYADPDLPLSHFLLGHLLDRKGKPSEARKHFRQTLRLLAQYRQDHVLPESEGMTAGRLQEVISSIIEQETE